MSDATAPAAITQTDRIPVVAPAPHIAAPLTARAIMLWVIAALVPSVIWAIVNMGWPAVFTLVMSIGSCVATEYIWNVAAKRRQTIGDYSAVLTGLLLAMTLPPLTPWWMCVLGGVVAIGLAKMLFGGLGFNLFNPALVGRAIVTMSWLGVMSEVTMNGKAHPGGFVAGINIDAAGKLDAITGATRLFIQASNRAANGAYHIDFSQYYNALLWRNTQGSLGEVSAALLILGGVVLLAKGLIDWRIPAGYIGSVALLSWLLGSDPVFNVLAGGVLLAAFFMATDYVTSPMTKWARVLFGIGCGTFNIVTRLYGPMPETAAFAVLFMNGMAPLLDRMFMPKPFGWVKPGAGAKTNA